MKVQKRREIEVNAVFDIECSDWTTFVVGAIRDENGYKSYRWQREEEFARMLSEFTGTIWSHAGGIYDLKWLLDWLVRFGTEVEVICAGSRIIILKTETATFCDSWALVPMSLKNFTATQGVHKEELALPCACGEECGGYCSISRKMARPLLQRLEQYLEADCESLWDALQTLQTFARDLDLDLGPTVGSSAWRCARRTSEGVPFALTDTQKALYTSIRPAYFGGRVEVYRFGLEPLVREYDVNSAYPWALTQPLPVGTPKRLFGSEARRAFDRGAPGIFNATVDQRGLHIPAMPVRTKARVVYPADIVSGIWARPELEHCAGKILDITGAIVYEREVPILKPWVDRLFKLRQENDPKSPLGGWLKLYLNSLSGKLGMRPERMKIHVNPEEMKFCQHKSTCYPICDGQCGAFFELSDHVFGEKTYALSDCARIEWASYLTSRARVLLHSAQIEKGGADMVYSDTDSIMTTGTREKNVGSAIGQFKFEGELKDFEAFAPKVYQAKKPDGARKVRAKGVKLPRSASLELGAEYRNDAGIVGVKLGAKVGKFFARKHIARTLQRRAGGRIMLDDGKTTRAPLLAEAMELE